MKVLRETLHTGFARQFHQHEVRLHRRYHRHPDPTKDAAPFFNRRNHNADLSSF